MFEPRLVIVLCISIFFWVVFIPDHRKALYFNRVRVGHILAIIVGSKDEWVNWRSLSFQLGSLSLLLWYVLFTILGLNQNLAVLLLFELLTIAAIQLFIKRKYHL